MPAFNFWNINILRSVKSVLSSWAASRYRANQVRLILGLRPQAAPVVCSALHAEGRVWGRQEIRQTRVRRRNAPNDDPSARRCFGGRQQ